MSNKVSEAVARPIRTTVQGGLSFTIVEFIDAFFYDMSDRQYGALIAMITILLSFIQTALENRTGVALLRQIPPKEVPVVEKDETGAYETGHAIILALAVVGIVLVVLLLAGVI